MEIRIVKVDVYRGMDREINVSDFKIIKSRNKFNSIITKWTDYIETYYTCENVKTIYYLSEIMMEELKNNGFELLYQEDCGCITDSGNNLGFGFHVKGEKMHLLPYHGKRCR